MDNATLAKYIGTDAATIQKLRQLDASAMYNHADYRALFDGLDAAYLQNTLPLVRKAYDAELPKFKTQLASKYSIDAEPMSAFTLGNWIVGILSYPERFNDLLGIHGKVPGMAIDDSLDTLVEMLGTMPEGASMWQHALCLLSLPLMQQN